MKVSALKTERIIAGQITLIELLDKYLDNFLENSVLVITSKVVSICENRVVPIGSVDKETLLKQESSYYLPGTFSKYNYHFSVTNNTLIAFAGIDTSNGNGYYILWPSDSFGISNDVREYLLKRFNIKNAGVLIVDSSSSPMRIGTIGIALGFSGFKPLNDYIGQPDLFGKPFALSRANVAGGLASSAVLVMGEGVEQTPLAIIEDVPFVEFVQRSPTKEELATMQTSIDDDLYGPFLSKVEWLKGDR